MLFCVATIICSYKRGWRTMLKHVVLDHVEACCSVATSEVGGPCWSMLFWTMLKHVVFVATSEVGGPCWSMLFWTMLKHVVWRTMLKHVVLDHVEACCSGPCWSICSYKRGWRTMLKHVVLDHVEACCSVATSEVGGPCWSMLFWTMLKQQLFVATSEVGGPCWSMLFWTMLKHVVL